MKINEQGFLEKIVDNFFGSLKRGVSDRYIAAAKKAGLDDETIKIMKDMEANYGDLYSKVKKSNK
jgi:hypothetical protein